MKQFFKFFFASCLSSAVVLFLAFIILIAIITSMISSTTKDTAVIRPQSVLYMKLNYDIPDRTNVNKFGIDVNSLALNMGDEDLAGMNDILANIQAAANDANISGIFLELSSIGTSTAYIQEIRNELLKFKKSGKFIISYADNYAQNAYFLGSVADKIYINPDGMLDIHGMASQIMFYKHLLEKLDIDVQIIRGPNNKFKSAVEPYFLDKMSDANREQMEKLLGSMWYQITNEISKSRNINMELINNVADSLTLLFDANIALKNNFVDGLLYKDELLTKLHEAIGIDNNKKINIIQNMQYATVRPKPASSSNKLAIIYASGEINEGEGSDNTIGSTTLSKAIREAREDNNVKAIVMRVNSPGGSALASEIIRREVELAASEKPFVISMGNYAASGGYWISTSANYIFADPTTLTGSIGVFGVIPNLQGFLTDKIGVTFDVAKTNKNADFGNLTKPLSPYQKAMMQKYVAQTYDEFTSLVAGTRNLRKDYVDSIGQGRVWTGIDALELGLVDQMGGIDQAINYAADKAFLGTDYSIKEYPKQKDIINQLLKGSMMDQYTKSSLKKKFGDNYSYLETLEKINNLNGIQARMPFLMNIE